MADLASPDVTGDARRREASALVAEALQRPAGAPVPGALVTLAVPYVRLRSAVLRLHPELWTVGKYLTVGATGVAVNLVVFSSARDFLGTAAVLALVASTIAFAVATAWNFTWNYLWTFHGRHSRPALHHGVGFAGASLAALGMNLLVLYLLVNAVPTIWAQFFGILSGTAFSFALNRGINFARAEPAGTG